MLNFIRSALGILLAATTFTGMARSSEPNYPTRPIRMVLGFAAGGGTDVTLRLLAARVSQQVGVPVVVENRTGAQGVLATQTVARAAADGYTILYNTSSLITAPALMRDPGYDWRRDLVPVAGLASVPLILVTPTRLETPDIRSFVALLKRQRDGLTYASAGIGNVTHLAAALLLQGVDASAVNVPYTGDGPALSDVLRGTVDFYMATINTALPFVREGRMRGLAVTSPDRAPSAPEIPTIAETVVPGYEVESWNGLMAPAGTPDAIVQRIGSEFLRALQDPETRSRLDQMGVIPRPRDQASYRRYVEDEARKWQQVISAAGIRLE